MASQRRHRKSCDSAACARLLARRHRLAKSLHSEDTHSFLYVVVAQRAAVFKPHALQHKALPFDGDAALVRYCGLQVLDGGQGCDLQRLRLAIPRHAQHLDADLHYGVKSDETTTVCEVLMESLVPLVVGLAARLDFDVGSRISPPRYFERGTMSELAIRTVAWVKGSHHSSASAAGAAAAASDSLPSHPGVTSATIPDAAEDPRCSADTSADTESEAAGSIWREFHVGHDAGIEEVVQLAAESLGPSSSAKQQQQQQQYRTLVCSDVRTQEWTTDDARFSIAPGARPGVLFDKSCSVEDALRLFSSCGFEFDARLCRSTPHDPLYASALLQQLQVAHWRRGLSLGDAVDARDSRGSWCEAVIVSDCGDKWNVHFRGWTNRFDEQISKQSPSLQPPYTRVSYWRQLRKSFRVEARGQDSQWYDKIVDDLLPDDNVTVSSPQKRERRNVSMHDESITAPGTHIKSLASFARQHLPSTFQPASLEALRFAIPSTAPASSSSPLGATQIAAFHLQAARGAFGSRGPH